MADQDGPGFDHDAEDKKAERERRAKFDGLMAKGHRRWEATAILNNEERAAKEKAIKDEIRRGAGGEAARSSAADERGPDRDGAARSSNPNQPRPPTAYDILKRENLEKQAGRQTDDRPKSGKNAEQESHASTEITDSKATKQEKLSRAEGAAREAERPRAPGRSHQPGGRGGPR